MLITVNRTKSVSCDHRLKANAPTDISSISTLYKTSAKIKIARRKKRESAKCFFKCTSGQKSTRILIKRKLSQSREFYSFHYVWLTLVCFGSWTCRTSGSQGPLGRRFMMSLFSTANQGQEFDLHMNNIQKNHSVKLSVMLLHRYRAIVWYAFGVAWLNFRGLGLL